MDPLFPVPDISATFSDIGIANVSPNVRQTWGVVRAEHARAADYFNGLIFDKKIDENTGDPLAPLLYPIQLNLVKMLVSAVTDSFVGDADESDDAILFTQSKSLISTDKLKKTAEFCSNIVRQSKGQQFLWELDFDRNLYGACVFRVMPAVNASGVAWRKVPLDAFYPIFDPEDPDNILECWVVNYLYPEQAKAKYGYNDGGSTGYVSRVEHWTLEEHKTYLNGSEISPYSGFNPWGIIPFVFTPRIRTTNIFGDSLARDIFGPQDEINMRMADAADALNYNTHPTRWGMNLPSSFSPKNYPVAADAMWDFGRAINKEMKPEVGILEVKEPIPTALFEYVKFLYDWSRTSAGAPPIAFGEDNGGGQRSGVTLEIRLWPLLKAMRTSRSFMATGIRRAMNITGRILKQKKFEGVEAYIYNNLIEGNVSPAFHNVMPRDQAATVDEVVKLLSPQSGPAISLETAQEILGRGPGELARIEALMSKLKEEELYPYKPEPPAPIAPVNKGVSN